MKNFFVPICSIITLFPGVRSEAKHLRRQRGRLWRSGPVLSFPIGIIVIIIKKEKIDLEADKMSNEGQL